MLSAMIEKMTFCNTRSLSVRASCLSLLRQKGIPKMSARAVGGAVGRNPISLFLPCHRVLGADGRLTGYGGGLEDKIFLLKLEGIPFRS